MHEIHGPTSMLNLGKIHTPEAQFAYFSQDDSDATFRLDSDPSELDVELEDLGYLLIGNPQKSAKIQTKQQLELNKTHENQSS